MTKCEGCDRELSESDFLSFNNNVVWFKCKSCGVDTYADIMTKADQEGE